MRRYLLGCLAVLLLGAPAVGEHQPVRGSDTVQWRVSPDGKARVKTLQQDQHASMGLLRFEKGATVPPHRHPKSTEMLYIRSGEGRMMVSGKEFVVKAGDMVSIPMGAEHSFIATEPGEAVQVYAPAGPEQRFLKWPAE